MISRKASCVPGLLMASCLVGVLVSSPVHASGGGSNDTPPKPTCPKGQIWDSKTGRCVSLLSHRQSDAELTDYAYRLAKQGRYEEALALLDTLEQPNTARALNYRGYATRKLGRTEEGIGYYLQAVKLDPRYAQVREYLGEAYVTQGRLDLARAQLQAIKSICSTTCEEYQDLADAIAHPGSG